MKKPIPHTTQSITQVSVSKKKPAGISKKSFVPALVGSPAGIQLYQLIETAIAFEAASFEGASSACCLFRLSAPKRSMMDRIALMPTPIQIGQCDRPFSHFAPKKPAITAPAKG